MYSNGSKRNENPNLARNIGSAILKKFQHPGHITRVEPI